MEESVEATPLAGLFGLELGRTRVPETEVYVFETDDWDVQDEASDPENDFYGIYYLCGMIGLALLFLFLGCFLWQGLKMLCEDPRKALSPAVFAFLIAFAIALVYALSTVSVLRRNNASFYFAVILGCIWHLSHSNPKARGKGVYTMRISVIIPVYNVEQYLPGCLESVLKNDTSDCEILLIDDGATDGSGAICDDYASRYPDLIQVIHQPNGGLGAARDTGIEAAAGEWLLFVDSDDKIHTDTLAVLKRTVTPELDVVGFQFFADDGENPPVPQNCGFPGDGVAFSLESRKEYLLSLPSAWMRLWRRTLFLENDIRYPSRVWYEDIRTTAKLLAVARKIVVLPEPLYYYLSRPGSIMNSSKLDRNREILEALDDIRNWFAEKGLAERYHDELEALTVQHVLLAASVRVARVDPKHPLLREFRTYTDQAYPNWRANPYQRSLPKGKRLALSLIGSRRYGLVQMLFKMKG